MLKEGKKRNAHYLRRKKIRALGAKAGPILRGGAGFVGFFNELLI